MTEEGVATAEFSKKVVQIVDLFTQLNVMELLQLQEALEAKGIKPAAAAVVVAGAGAPGRGDAGEVVEKTTFDVILKAAGEKKINVIKEVRAITNLGLKEAKDLVEGAPKTLKEGVSKEEAERIKKQLQGVGAEVELK